VDAHVGLLRERNGADLVRNEVAHSLSHVKFLHLLILSLPVQSVLYYSLIISLRAFQRVSLKLARFWPPGQP
jgi:hypothetical protein